jgi:UDP-N-acetylmuramoylalanine--D-glutamate ligase
MDYKEYFKGKKITIMGLGLLGRGLGDAIFLAECGAELIITDLRDKKTLKPSLEKLKKFKNIKYTLGKHDLKDFEFRDFILKAAGIPLDSEFIIHARKNKIPIEMDASLFSRIAQGVITIGITGTRGKTTVTSLIYKILSDAFKKKSQKVYLAGNIRDTATLPLIKKVKRGDIVVMELDSWQLQGFGDSKISPHISVFTNLMEDHLNYYKGSLEKYLEDKAQIFLHQKQNDYFITGEKVAHLITAKYHDKLNNLLLTANPPEIPLIWKLPIIGEHNKENIALALKVARIMKIPDSISKKSIENFKSVEGRLQKIKSYKGITIWNDNNSTTPDATIAALNAFPKDKKIVLIIGGSDKNISFDKLIEEINNTCKSVVLLPGSGSDKLKANTRKLTASLVEVKNLNEAVKKALSLCVKGDVLLFSPAFASFGLFKNEYDRNDQFMKIIKGLK